MRTRLVIAAVLVLGACSSGGGGPTPSSTATPSGTPSLTSSPQASATRTSTPTTTDVSVYFLRGEQLQPVRRAVTGAGVGAAAVRALLDGPSAAERRGGLTSTVPTGTALLGLDIAGGTATVDLTGRFESGGGSLSMTARVAQVVFTLTRFPNVDRVVFELDGTRVTALGGEGVDLSTPRTRADSEELSPAVLIESPLWEDSTGIPLRVIGTANVFEAVFFLEVRDATDVVVFDQRVMASSGTGTRGVFDVTLKGRSAVAGRGLLTAYTLSAKDGSRVDEMSVPLRLTG